MYHKLSSIEAFQVETEQNHGLYALVSDIVSRNGVVSEHIEIKRTSGNRDGSKFGSYGEVKNANGDVVRYFVMTSVKDVARTVWVGESKPGLWCATLSGSSVPLFSGQADRPFSVIHHLIETDKTLSASEILFAIQVSEYELRDK